MWLLMAAGVSVARAPPEALGDGVEPTEEHVEMRFDAVKATTCCVIVGSIAKVVVKGGM